jgi:hypothetical protein
MAEHLYLFSIIAGLLYLIFAIRLRALSRRTHERPEYFLALHYLFMGTSYVLFEVPGMFEANLDWVILVARLVFTVGIVFLLLFSRAVFRNGSRWATALLWSNALILFSGVTFSTLDGDIEGLIVTSIWFYFDWIGYTAPYLWIAAEALLAYGAARKRARIGLCAPESVNRFLLWSWFGMLVTLANLLLIAVYIEYERTQLWPRWGDYASGGLEASATVALWFVFFPPAWYRHWLNRATTRPDAGGTTGTFSGQTLS